MSTAPAPTPVPQPAPAHRGLSGWDVAMIVVGCVVALVAAAVLAAGLAVAFAGKSPDGYRTVGPASVATQSYAVTAPDIGVDVRGPDEAYARDLLGTIRIRATGADPARPIFLGIARTADADAYLGEVGYDQISDIEVDPVRVEYDAHAGGGPATPPTAQTFWERSDSGPGTRTLTWELATGDWTVVVMNADGSPGVRAELDLGGTLPVLRWVTVGLLVGGGLALLGGLALVVLPLATRRRDAT